MFDRSPCFPNLEQSPRLRDHQLRRLADLRLQQLGTRVAIEGVELAGRHSSGGKVEPALQLLQDEQRMTDVRRTILDSAGFHRGDCIMDVLHQPVVKQHNHADGACAESLRLLVGQCSVRTFHFTQLELLLEFNDPSCDWTLAISDGYCWSRTFSSSYLVVNCCCTVVMRY